MGKLKSESQAEIDDFLSDLSDDEIKIFESLLGSQDDLGSMFNAMRKMQSKKYSTGGFVDPESPKAQMDKINISIILNMGKESEMNPSDDGNQNIM